MEPQRGRNHEKHERWQGGRATDETQRGTAATEGEIGATGAGPGSPSDDDPKLLQAVHRGEFAIHGFRNRDLRAILYTTPADATTAGRQSAAVTRRIRLLRAHRLIAKVPKTHRYQLTDLGRAAITALLQAQQAHASQLQQLAA